MPAPALTLTKSDLLTFLDAPMHLWAAKHDRIEKAPSALDQHNMLQGQEVEKLAQVFLQERLFAEDPDLQIEFQHTVVDGAFVARLDALVFDPAAGAYDLYEVKSATSVKPEHKVDVAFQALAAAASLPLRHCYLVLVDKEYVRAGAVDPSRLFTIEPADEFVADLHDGVLAAREAALRAAATDAPAGLEACRKPDDCPCPALCHPALLEYPIYDLPRLQRAKTNELREQGILSIDAIPADFPLSERQAACVQAVRRRAPLVDREAIISSLESLVYPLYFLDYEAYNPAVPLYDGYHPYEYVTFQYSLHVLDAPNEALRHTDCLVAGEGDPAPELAASLRDAVGAVGSVVVWNKAFEMGRNKEMAARLPEFKDFFEDLNARVYDLMEIFSRGYYVHPDFHGSTSIKKVLPVLAAGFEKGYKALAIPQGDEAMLAWLELAAGRLPAAQAEAVRADLLEYCALDTQAMVEVWSAAMEASAIGG